MGFVSRKLFPACESMCICCPALRSRSRQPVKRYKKLLADIFPKSIEGLSNDRKIVKLCEYAAKNPFRIPKIVKYLEERCCKELRTGHINFINVIAETYEKLLSMCSAQMPYFAISLLIVAKELLDNCQHDDAQILGCQVLSRFIYSQSDATYTHNIEKFVHRICTMAREKGDGHQRRSVKASSLQCLSAMVWFISKFSNIFTGFDEIVHATLDNYESDAQNDESGADTTRHWVDEVVRSEGRVGGESSPSSVAVRQHPQKKDPSLLTREESETPEIWAQICLQRMAELANESNTTMRDVLDPMFIYFDSGRHWVPRQGLALVVLSDFTYMVENSVTQQSILASVIRRMDYKKIFQDPQLKTCLIRVATVLARQIRLEAVLSELGFVSDLCRHLRKSLQATMEDIGEEEMNINTSLQTAIEDCLLEVAKGIGDAQPLFDMMAINLENLPSSGVPAKASIGSSMILAHVISLALVSSGCQQVFPDSLLLPLLQAMLHPDMEVRIGAHQMLSILLIPNSNRSRHEVRSLRSNSLYEPRKWQSSTESALVSVTARLEKLRKEKNGTVPEKNSDELKEAYTLKNSTNFRKISTGFIEEPYVLSFTEDQIAQLLSCFWLQSIAPNNLPSNIEAIAHSYVLTVLSSRLMNTSNNTVTRIFQLPLALKNISFDTESLPPSARRSVLTLSVSMLMFAAKIYHIPDAIELLKPLQSRIVDPYLGIDADFQVFVKPLVDVRDYGSVMDNQLASTIVDQLLAKFSELENRLLDTLAQNLSTELEADDVKKQLSEQFTPDETFMFGQLPMLGFDHKHSKMSMSFDDDFPMNSSVEDDTMSEASVADLSRFIPKMSSPTMSHVISIGQLLESSLMVAGQVVGTSISTSPLPYDTMASQCQALGMGPRKKLSNWLVHEDSSPEAADIVPFPSHLNGSAPSSMEMVAGILLDQDPMSPPEHRCLAMKLPPASPYDNFLKAARY